MVKAEHTHEGDKCTFEVMLDRIGSNDAALRAIAEIVHDIDLKDGKFGREQAGDIAHVIAGVCMTQPDDLARIERGSAFFDDTYEYFRRNRSGERSTCFAADAPFGPSRKTALNDRAQLCRAMANRAVTDVGSANGDFGGQAVCGDLLLRLS
jgi:Chromate resistance exported protein